MEPAANSLTTLDASAAASAVAALPPLESPPAAPKEDVPAVGVVPAPHPLAGDNGIRAPIKRKRAKTSSVWKHFVEVESDRNTAICNHCNRGINRGRNARNTTNLHQHLRIRHPEVIIEPLNCFHEKRKAAKTEDAPALEYAPAGAARSVGVVAYAAAVPLARFLAEAGLPLHAGMGPAMHRLATAWGVPGALPEADAMRRDGIPAAVEATQAAVRSAIAGATVSVVVGEAADGVRIVRCIALNSRFERATYALAVEDAECDPALLAQQTLGANGGGAGRVSPAMQGRLANLVAKYAFMEKLHFVVVPEHSGQFEMLSFCPPREDPMQIQQGDTVFQHIPGQEFLEEVPRVQESSVPIVDLGEAGTTSGFGASRSIPVVPCLVRLLEHILDVSVLSNPWIESAIMVPVRNAMYPNLPKRNVKKEKKARRSLVDDMVPMEAEGATFGRKDAPSPSEESQVRVLKAKDLLTACIKKYGSLGTGRTVDSVDLTLAHKLHKTLMVFDEACTLLIGVESNGLLSEGAPISVAIPVMRSVSRALEMNSKAFTGELLETIKRVLKSVHQTQRELELQEIYAVATMLDPRFKGRSFASDESLGVAEANVLNACRALKRARESHPGAAEAAAVFVTVDVPKTGGGMLGQFMDEVVHDKLDAAGSVSAYLAEPVFSYSEDVGKYWQRNAARWPDLTAVAAKYLCGPSCVRRPVGDKGAVSELEFDPQDKGSMLFLRLNASLHV